MDMKKLRNVTPHILILLIIMSIVGSRFENLIYRIKNRGTTYAIYGTGEDFEGENYDSDMHFGGATGDIYSGEYNPNADYGYSYEIRSVGPITLEKATYTEYIYFTENSDYILIETYPEIRENIIEEYEEAVISESSKSYYNQTSSETVVEASEAVVAEEVGDNLGLNIKILDENKEIVKEFKAINNQAVHRVELEDNVKGKTYEVVASGPGFYGYYNVIWGTSYQED